MFFGTYHCNAQLKCCLFSLLVKLYFEITCLCGCSSWSLKLCCFQLYLYMLSCHICVTFVYYRLNVCFYNLFSLLLVFKFQHYIVKLFSYCHGKLICLNSMFTFTLDIKYVSYIFRMHPLNYLCKLSLFVLLV